MNRCISVLLFFYTILITGCKKNEVENSPTKGLLTRIINTLLDDTTNYYYNSSNQVILLTNTPGVSGAFAISDTFIYENNRVITMQYSITGDATHRPYVKSNYIYEMGVLKSSDLYSYWFSSNVLECKYFFDTKNRLDSIRQTVFRKDIGPLTKSTKYEYDENSNLSKIFYTDELGEYLYMSFSDYDNHSNPRYNFPWMFSNDFEDWNCYSLSKNNPGIFKTYFRRHDGIVENDRIFKYTYKYDNEGKVVERQSYMIFPDTFQLSSDVYYYSQ